MAINYKKSNTGNISIGVFGNVLMWLVVFAIGVVLFLFIKKLFPGNVLDGLNKKDKDEIKNHAQDRMSNGSTYFDTSKYLFENIYGNRSILGWLYDTDEVAVGTQMLSVTKSEYPFLSNVYFELKNSKAIPIIGGYSSSLTDDLRGVFSTSEQKRYLSHLGII